MFKIHVNIIINLIIIFLSFPAFLASQTTDSPGMNQTENLQALMEDGMNEIDFYSLEELLNVEVEVASLFEEDELIVGSTVASITPERWKRMGARRVYESLNNEMGVMLFPTFGGSIGISIRGYTTSLSAVRGTSLLIDGVPMNGLSHKTALYQLPNWELGTLNSIEMIKGPGSAIYGEDAFHGVLSFKTFESDKDIYQIEAAGAYPMYGDASVRLSQGIADNLIRIDLSAGGSYQGDQKIENNYDRGRTFVWASLPVDFRDYPAGTNTRKDAYQNGTGLLKLTVAPSKKMKIRASGYVNSCTITDYAGLGFYGPEDLQNLTAFLYMGSGSAEYTFNNDISVEVNGYYWQFETLQDAVFGISYRVDDSVRNMSENAESRVGTNLTVKQPDNFLNIQWVLGYSYSEIKIMDDIKSKFRETDTHIVLARPVLKYAGYQRDINSAFSQIKWGAIKKSLYLLAGARYDSYSDFGQQVTPRGGIIFLPTTESSIKALYGRAFRAPAGIELKGTDTTAGNTEIKPETIDCYELIYIYKAKNFKVSLNTFYSYWNDAIETYVNNKYDNISESRSIGGEADLLYTMEPAAFDLGFAFVKSTKLDAIDQYTGEKTDIAYGAYPLYSIRAGIYYTAPGNIRFYLNNRIYLNMTEDSAPHSEKLPPYWRMDLDISKMVAEKLEIHLNGRNLLNRQNRVPGIWHDKGTLLTYDSDGIPEGGLSVLIRASYKI